MSQSGEASVAQMRLCVVWWKYSVEAQVKLEALSLEVM